MTKRRLVLIASAALLTAAVAGVGWAAGAYVFRDDPITRPPGQDRLGQKIAAFPAQPGRADAAVYLARRADGFMCLNSAAADTASFGGGCNPAGDPLGGKPLMVLFAYDGGPAVETVTDARLYGLVDHSVKEVTVEMTDGSTRPVRLSANDVGGMPYRVFAERVSMRDLKAAITPTAVVAYDATGREIARQATGFVDRG